MWAFDKIDGLPRSPNRYAQEGLDLHTAAEAWLRDGTPPDLTTDAGRTLNGGIHHLPPPRSVEVEITASFERHGIAYSGRVDFFSEKHGVALVGDHKSTGDLVWADEKLAKLEAHDDPQWLFYGAWAVVERRADLVRGHWVYYQRRKPYPSRLPEVHAHAPALLEHFDTKIHPVALRILAARDEPSEARPRTLSRCSRYGGCPYKDRCLSSVPVTQRIAAMTTDLNDTRAKLAARAQPNSFAARLAEQRAKTAAATRPPEPSPVLSRDEDEEKREENERHEFEPSPADFGDASDCIAEIVSEQFKSNVEAVADRVSAMTEDIMPEPPKKRGRPKGSGKKAPPRPGDDRPAPVAGEIVDGPATSYSPERLDRAEALDVLVKLHAAAIGAHQPPEVANTHYRSILDFLSEL